MPAAEAVANPAAREDLVHVFLMKNVCIDGRNLGPSYGSPVAAVPRRWARLLIRRYDARLAHLGPCSQDTRRCDTAIHSAMETPQCCIEGAVTTLRKVQELFLAYGVNWWADYGTALGVATGEGFYWNDKDCDIGVMRSDLETVLRMKQLFEREGFCFDYRPPGADFYHGGDMVKIRWSTTNHMNTDIFFWEDRDGMLHRRNYVPVDQFKGREFPAAWVNPVVPRRFEDLEVPCPVALEELVAHRYGEGWRDLPAALHGSERR